MFLAKPARDSILLCRRLAEGEIIVVRGCEKRIYHVKNTESEIFDEAYLILRREGRGRSATPRELEREAMRIVSGVVTSGSSSGERPKSREKLRAFLAGVLASALLIGIVSLVLWLVL